MSDVKPGKQETQKQMEPGFCSATCTDRACLQHHINKPEIKTSDIYATCNLPKRFEYPHCFNGYGCQLNSQHPLYRTTSSEYGWYPPGIHSVPSVYFPAGQTFTNRLAAAGVYRNYSLNTGMDPVGYSWLNMI
ncbi:unnamed protein product [Parnassius apollo]|uniref:(apollo) hypothetical protein n=1 Tax=Parnassius apollo TaxID=110799 RepID=A0A8S3XS57_PARAO|nr:unnamed protein product [Parnassius apollo]